MLCQWKQRCNANPTIQCLLLLLLLWLTSLTCYEQLVQYIVGLVEVEDQVKLTHVAKVHVQHLAAKVTASEQGTESTTADKLKASASKGASR
jgi:hypothetical protein